MYVPKEERQLKRLHLQKMQELGALLFSDYQGRQENMDF